MKYYIFDKETKVFLSEGSLELDVKRTLALKKSIFKGSVPENSTTKKPIGEPGKCWFVKNKWTDKNPVAKKEAPVAKKVDERKKYGSFKKQ